MCLINVKDEGEREEPVRFKVQKVQRPTTPTTSRNEQRSTSAQHKSISQAPSTARRSYAEGRSSLPSERRTSREPSRAPSIRSRAQSAYIEVDHELSSSSDESDVRSRKTSRTSKSGRSKTTAPMSEYSMHEREVRREKIPPHEQYETYRYVEPPAGYSRGSGRRSETYDEPRASRDSIGRRVRIEIDH